MFELLRQNEGFISRSREILSRLIEFNETGPGIKRLQRGLETVSAALILGERLLADLYFQKYVEDCKLFLTDKPLMERELCDMGYCQDDYAGGVYLAVCYGIYVSILLDLREVMEEIALSADSHPIQQCIGPCENYLIGFALGRVEAAENERLNSWRGWLDDEIVFEEDKRWTLAVPIARRDQEAFMTELVKQNQERKRKILEGITHPFTHWFPDHVLGLELVTLIYLARRRGLQVDESFSKGYGLYRLSLECADE
ncbi:MAG TPA: hypothetical protein VF268_15420 [Gammaproteobacteria bacterium]